MDRERLRRTDFWTGFGLAACAVAMLVVTSGFPMSGSYGGVHNVWYVSPALFPLIVGFGILGLSLLLVVNAARELGRDGLRQALSWPRGRIGPRGQRFAMIVMAIAGYVYVMVPAVDFFLATTLLLLVFMAAFHLPDGRGLVPNLLLYLAALVLVALLRWIDPDRLAAAAPILAHVLAHVLDLVVLAGIAGALWVNRRLTAAAPEARRRLRQVLWMVAVTPAVLCVLFRYGLLVPLPHEGLVINLMEAARYALRA